MCYCLKKRKKHIIWLSVLVLGLSTYHLINHVSKQTTYGEVVSATIEAEAIQSISITSYDTGERISVTDPEMINTFINGASESTLTKSINSDGNPLKYLVYFHTDTEHSYDIYTSLRLNDSMIQYGGYFYAFNDDHSIYQLTEDIFSKNSQQGNGQ
jgi:hypothetical protein